MNDYVSKLRENNELIERKKKEIISLRLCNDELWRNLVDEFIGDIEMYRAVDGLSGLVEVLDLYVEEGKLALSFSDNIPSANGLAFIEKNTGLKFNGSILGSNKVFAFGLYDKM